MICRTPQPLSLRISVTGRCPLRCVYCMPAGLAEPATDGLTIGQIAGFVSACARHAGLSKVHLTGGEPLARPDIVELVAALAQLPIPDLALTTNGQDLARLAGPLRRAGLRRINVSLDSLDAEAYRTLTRGGDVGRTMAGIAAAIAAGLGPIKINVLVLRGVNDGQIASMVRWALERSLVVRFLELMPIGPARARHQEWFVSSGEVLQRLRQEFDIEPAAAQPGGSTRLLSVRDRQGLSGMIGLISSGTAPFCQGCRRLRLTADGQLVGCLAAGQAVDIAPLLSGPSCDGQALAAAIEQALATKQPHRVFSTENLMARTGG